VLLKIPTHTLTQRLQLCAFLKKRIFTLKHDMSLVKLKKGKGVYMHKVIIELSLKFIFIFIFFEILLVHKTGELDNKAKTTHFIFDSIIKT
jgi:hypothetical protein